MVGNSIFLGCSLDNRGYLRVVDMAHLREKMVLDLII